MNIYEFPIKILGRKRMAARNLAEARRKMMVYIAEVEYANLVEHMEFDDVTYEPKEGELILKG